MAAQDKERKEVAEIKKIPNTFIKKPENQLEEFKDKIDDELRKEINEQVAVVLELLGDENADKQRMKDEIEKLNKVMSKIGEKIYAANPQSGGEQQATDSSSDDTSNEEYEEKKEK
eukprot:1059082_1